MGVAALGEWVLERALPLWGGAGWDAASGQFVEQLGFDGSPQVDVPRRSMVQARQIYVYGLAKLRGWPLPPGIDPASLSLRAGRALVDRYWRAGGQPGWAFSVGRLGGVVNPKRDLYAHAFILLALSTLERLAPGEGWRDLAEQTLDFLDDAMQGPLGGYAEAWPIGPESLPRRQNPHMHLFESLLAWVETDPTLGTKERAEELRALCEARFISRSDDDRIALVEFFDTHWNPRGGPDFPFEPGHHFEWAWLLSEQARLADATPSPLAMQLYAAALDLGFHEDGSIHDEVTLSGRVPTPGARLWPHTEAIRAMRVLGPRHDRRDPQADDVADVLMARFLQPTGIGLWFDHFDGEGRLKRDNAPASSLYHLVGAIA